MKLIQKNDIIVLQLTEHMSNTKIKDLTDKLEELFNIKTVIVPLGITLDVYRKG